MSRGNICWYQDLLGLLTVEAVPNTNDIICRASDQLVLLVDVQSQHVALVGALAFLGDQEIEFVVVTTVTLVMLPVEPPPPRVSLILMVKVPFIVPV